MSGLVLHHTSPHCTVGVDMGAFRCITQHVGLDHVHYLDIIFGHGRISVDTATWTDVLRRTQEEVVAALRDPDLSGARADIPEVGA